MKDIHPPHARKTATLTGCSAVIMWAFLALFTKISGNTPPFQLASMTFAIGTIVGLIWTVITKNRIVTPKIPIKVICFGGLGLFSYHALYFAALANAPAEEASLIAYLWPLLIVTGSALLPGEHLKKHHIGGALAGFSGTILIINGGKGLIADTDHLLGYILALAAAFTWTAYSLAARNIANIPTISVIYYCAFSSVLACIAHIIFEQTIIPQTINQWLAITGLGLFPVGAAFYVWDHGMKHGDVQIIGAFSYTAPLLSTLILIAITDISIKSSVVLACILITFGAVLAAKDIIFKK